MSKKHEPSDINVKVVAIVSGAFIALSVVLTIILWFIYEDRFIHTKQTSNESFFRIPPSPELQAEPKWELEELQGRHLKHLDSYGWVDREGHIVHIPIEKAMEMYLNERPPHREEP